MATPCSHGGFIEVEANEFRKNPDNLLYNVNAIFVCCYVYAPACILSHSCPVNRVDESVGFLIVLCGDQGVAQAEEELATCLTEELACRGVDASVVMCISIFWSRGVCVSNRAGRFLLRGIDTGYCVISRLVVNVSWGGLPFAGFWIFVSVCTFESGWLR